MQEIEEEKKNASSLIQATKSTPKRPGNKKKTNIVKISSAVANAALKKTINKKKPKTGYHPNVAIETKID